MATVGKTANPPKAVPQLGPFPSKIGSEELLEVLDLWQFSPETKKQIAELVKTDRNLQGPHLFRYYNPRPSKVEAAEKALAELTGVRHCLAVNSCTSALVCAYRALGIGAGDEVIVPAYTFFATAATVVACNAIPVIVEVDDSLCLDPAAAEKAITKRTKAIVPVHMRGAPAQMDAILDLGRRKGIPIVEDVAQSGGGSFQGKRLGSLGTVGCFSFDYYKVHASGEGGFVTTNDEWLYTRAQSWHDTAACWRPDRFSRERKPGELFCGENYRMSELQGAVALAQIRKTDVMLAGYRRAFRRIKEAIEPVPGLTFRRVPDAVGRHEHLPDPVPQGRRDDAKGHAGDAGPGGARRRNLRSEGPRLAHLSPTGSTSWRRSRLPPTACRGAPCPTTNCRRYSKDMCPRTLDLLSRAIMIEINWHYSDEDCDRIALGINRALQEVS